MTAARRLVTMYPLDRRARDAAPSEPAAAPEMSSGTPEMSSGTVRLGDPSLRKTPRALAVVGTVAVQPAETCALGSDGIVGQEHPAVELGRNDDRFAEDPAHLRWLGRLVCWMTATSTSAMILWALVG
jgi:hypothetical protein